MKHLFIASLLFLTASIQQVSAQGFSNCSYGSTQVRVQPNVQTNWTNYLAVSCGQNFNVGAFHDNTGQFASDTSITVTGPNGFQQNAGNGQSLAIFLPGRYQVTASTNNQYGSACTESVPVDVTCFGSPSPSPSPTPSSSPTPPPACQYGSTQARVQPDFSKEWRQHYDLGCNATFNVGSFHDHSGQFANDTQIKVTAPNGHVGMHTNGQVVPANQNGQYRIEVTTNNGTGSACTEQATINVSCQQTQICSYANTQARLQHSNNGAPWQQNLSLGCFETFRVGSFHNNTGQYASDTKLEMNAEVDIPLFGRRTLTRVFNNGDMVRPLFPGNYRLTVTTNNQSGSACTEQVSANVSCDFVKDYLSGWNIR